MLICVTGANGFIGRHLVSRLVREGHHVRILSRSKGNNFPSNVEVFKGDLVSGLTDLSSFVSGCSLIFHCAGELTHEALMESLHVGGTQRLLSAALNECSLGHYIHWIQLSSVGVYGQNLAHPIASRVVNEKSGLNPLGVYESTKAKADELLLNEHTTELFSYTILRPSNVFGIGMPNTSLASLIKAVARGIFFYIGKPGAVATYVHVDVVVEALLACGFHARARNKIYNLSDDSTIESLIQEITHSIRVKKPRLRMPYQLIISIVGFFGPHINLPLTISRINALASRTSYPADLIINELNFIIHMPTLDAIKEYAKDVIGDNLELMSNKEKNNSLPKLCIVSTIAWPIKVYMGPHIIKLSEFLNVSIAASQANKLVYFFPRNVNLFNIEINRKINIIADIASFYKLWNYFKNNKFYCVHSIMPKSGLISMCAARLAGVPHRFHTFTGQVWAVKNGFPRYILKLADKAIAGLATTVLTDSFSQREFLIANRIVAPKKIKVLGNGSIVGVNTDRFAPNHKVRSEMRNRLNISTSDVVFIFVGRLNRDKGIIDLVQAFRVVVAMCPGARLILVGDDEGWHSGSQDDWGGEVSHLILHVPFTSEPESYMAMADILCLPSYREGFGNVLIEAASVGLPTIASRIYGISDAVIDGQTGILHEPGNISQIINAMIVLALNYQQRRKMGEAGRERVVRDFSDHILTNAFESFYRDQGVF